MHVRHGDTTVYNDTDNQYVSSVNFPGGAERVLMVRIRNGLSTVECSIYNKDRYLVGMITAVTIAGATDHNITIGTTNIGIFSVPVTYSGYTILSFTLLLSLGGTLFGGLFRLSGILTYIYIYRFDNMEQNNIQV